MAHPYSGEDSVATREQPARSTVVSFPQFSSNCVARISVPEATVRPPHLLHAEAKSPTSSRTPAPNAQQPESASVSAIERRFCKRLLQAIGGQSIRFVLWNGEEISVGNQAAAVRIVIHDRSTFRRLLFDSQWEFGEAYSEGRLEIDGSLRELLEIHYRTELKDASGEKRLPLPMRLLRPLRHWQHTNSVAGSRDNIHHHYDLGNDFYRLWLDQQLVYSCAYFADPSMSLDEAQREKLDYVCRKLRLQTGETVVEIGGGWGALAVHIAKHYGCRVRSFNISGEQIEMARHRVRTEGLDGQIEIVEDDYRNAAGRFDALVSLGMLEHVGRKHYREFGEVVDRCLSPTGRALIQTIGQNTPSSSNPWIERRIFPGGHLPTLREFTDIVEPWKFSVIDIENLRPHYARTLECWLARFEAAAGKVRQMFDDRFVRMWRLYLTGSAAAFAAGALQLFQVLLARPARADVAWTRADWYR